MAKLTATILLNNKEIEQLKKVIEHINKHTSYTKFQIDLITEELEDLANYRRVTVSNKDIETDYINKNKASNFYHLGFMMNNFNDDMLSSARRKTLSSKPQVIAKTKGLPPFYAPGKTSFNIQNVPGVYKIYESGKIVYIGSSKTNVYKSLYRHFYPYKERTNQDRKYWKDLTNITVKVIYTKTPGRAENLEIALIHKHKPKYNTIQYKNWTPTQKEKSILEIYENTQDIVIDDNKDLPF